MKYVLLLVLISSCIHAAQQKQQTPIAYQTTATILHSIPSAATIASLHELKKQFKKDFPMTYSYLFSGQNQEHILI